MSGAPLTETTVSTRAPNVHAHDGVQMTSSVAPSGGRSCVDPTVAECFVAAAVAHLGDDAPSISPSRGLAGGEIRNIGLTEPGLGRR